MAVDERRRSQLFQRLAGAVGEDAATTMFELLPPADSPLATADDVARLEERMDQQFAHVGERFALVDQRIDRLEDRMEEGFAAIRQELSALRGEITNAVAGQTRAVLLGVLTAVFGIGGLAYTFSRFL